MPLRFQQQIQILHVDDEPSFAELTETFLERESDRFAVETATSADEGLGHIDDCLPDCVVSDYNMPGRDGIEFLQAVREEYPDLPFILFTGKGSEEVASDAIAAGVTDYIQKGSGPDRYALLANRIENAVESKREAQRADRREQLMRLTEFAGDVGGFELDVDSEELLLTDGARRLIGLSEDTQITPDEAVELYHPDHREDVRQTVRRVAETGEQMRRTWCLETLDGDERRLDVTITPVTEHGAVTTLRGALHDITERRERRQELEQIETVFQNAQAGLFLLNPDGEFAVERVNPAFEEMMGVPAKRARGQSLREFLGAQAGAVAESQCRECVERRESLEIERTLRREGEQTHWVTRLAPVVVDGTVEHIAGSTRNVTTQRERQRELQQLQQAIDNASVAITLADPTREDNPLVYVNDAFEELTGYLPEETLGRNCRYLQGESTDPEKTDALREAIDSEESISVELRNYRKDDTEFWNRLTVTPIYDDEGNLVRYLGTQEDVTERKERERELRAERQFIEQALDALDDLFYVLDTDGTLRRWNSKLPEVTGYTEQDLSGMRAAELFPEDERETIADSVETTLTQEQVTVEVDLRTADGERLPYEFTGAQLTDADGNVTGLVGIGRDLTERRRRERRFQALVEESSDIVSIVDAEGVFQYQSPSIERILGYHPEETVGDTAWEYVHPEDRADLIRSFERGVANPDVTPITEYRARRADGSWCWLEARGNNQFDNPAVEGYIVNSRDITQSKEREQELERTRSLLSDMEQLADIGAWEYDPDAGEPVHTAGELRIYGLDPEADLTVDEALECYHPADRDRLEARFRECLETGDPYEMDLRVNRADGEQRWVTARGERIQQGDRNVIRGYVQDITDQKERIDTLEQIETLFENTQDMLFIVERSDDEFRIKRVNHAFESTTGLPREDIQGKTIQELLGTARGEQSKERYRRCIETGDSLSYEESLPEEQTPNKSSPTGDGLTYWETHITPVSTDSDVDWIVGATRDINEQKRRERELQRRNERLDEFTSIISHDLRSPLSVADGMLELAREDCDSEHIDSAADAVSRCQALVDDMLTLAREGKRVAEVGSVALADTAKQSWQTVGTDSAELNTETTQQVQADSSRLQQLFENLYRNAVEHGGGDVTIHVGETDDGFYVADTGPGIPESERSEVFQAGYSTNEDGTGFGLRIVEQIAHAHGWTVTVTESEQGGARFEFTGVRSGD